MKRAFTLIELIFTIIISAILSIGTFKFISQLYQREVLTKEAINFSINSQIVLDQLSSLLYYRVPNTVIAYDPVNDDFKPLRDANSSYKIIEFITDDFDSRNRARFNNQTLGFSGFIDLDGSDRNTHTLLAKDFNITDVNNTQNNIFKSNKDVFDNNLTAIIFAGSFDDGQNSNDYNNSYGWHDHNHSLVYMVINKIQENNDSLLQIDNSISGKKIYEKFYLVNSAYAIARGEDINQSANCITNLNIPTNEINNTLFLFYNYRPWIQDENNNSQTFCADTNGILKEGNVTILSKHISGFKAKDLGGYIELKITYDMPLKGSDKNITISKQKVAF